MATKWNEHRGVRWALILAVVTVWIVVAVRVASVYSAVDEEPATLRPSKKPAAAAVRSVALETTVLATLPDPFDPERGRPKPAPPGPQQPYMEGPPPIDLPDYTLTAIVDQTAVIELPGGASVVVRKGEPVLNPEGTGPVRLVTIQKDYVEVEFGGALYTLGLTE